MKNELLPLKKDLIFRKIFSDNIDRLKVFLRTVLSLPENEYDGLTLLDPHTTVTHGADKYSIMDLRAKTTSGITVQLMKKEKYSKVKPVISIAILDYDLYPYVSSADDSAGVDLEPFHY